MLEQYNKSKQLSKSLTEKLNEILTIEDEEINSRWEHNPINDTYSHKKNEVTK